MNDYLMKSLIRQRHEEILAEFRGIRMSRLKRGSGSDDTKEKKWGKRKRNHPVIAGQQWAGRAIDLS